MPNSEARPQAATATDTALIEAMENVNLLLSGLASQYPAGTFREFAKDVPTKKTWAMSLAAEKIQRWDVTQFLAWNIKNVTKLPEINLGFIMQSLTDFRETRKSAERLRNGGRDNSPMLSAPGRRVSREVAERGIAAMRAAIRGSKAKPERYDIEYLGEAV